VVDQHDLHEALHHAAPRQAPEGGHAVPNVHTLAHCEQQDGRHLYARTLHCNHYQGMGVGNEPGMCPHPHRGFLQKSKPKQRTKPVKY
jgi:hypothetical protein